MFGSWVKGSTASVTSPSGNKYYDKKSWETLRPHGGLFGRIARGQRSLGKKYLICALLLGGNIRSIHEYSHLNHTNVGN